MYETSWFAAERRVISPRCLAVMIDLLSLKQPHVSERPTHSHSLHAFGPKLSLTALKERDENKVRLPSCSLWWLRFQYVFMVQNSHVLTCGPGGPLSPGGPCRPCEDNVSMQTTTKINQYVGMSVLHNHHWLKWKMSMHVYLCGPNASHVTERTHWRSSLSSDARRAPDTSISLHSNQQKTLQSHFRMTTTHKWL